MNEKDAVVLSQYDIDVKEIKRGRGSFVLTTNKGYKLLTEYVGSKKHIEGMAELTRSLKEAGFDKVDTICPTKTGELYYEDEEKRKFCLKDWFDAKECDVKSMPDIMASVGILAKLHLKMYEAMPYMEEDCTLPKAPSLFEQYDKQIRELKRVKKYLKEKHKKNGFEMTALNCFDEFYDSAVEARSRLLQSTYDEQIRNAREKKELCHGAYNHHNILFGRGFIALTNFDKAKCNLAITDLYDFMRKLLEKYNWDIKLAYKMLDEYNKVKPITDGELEVLSVMFSYPEKFWKIINFYYNSSKAWIPEKNTDKLNVVISQNYHKRKFVDTLS